MLLKTRLLGARQILVQLLIVLLKIVSFIYIATYNYEDKELTLFDGGWQSNTTKSRLNALCYEFATGFSVFQKNWNWFVSDFQSKTIKPFCDGLIVDYSGCF